MKTFKYRIIHEYNFWRGNEFEDMSIEDALNKLGSEGWELVNINVKPNNTTGLMTLKKETTNKNFI